MIQLLIKIFAAIPYLHKLAEAIERWVLSHREKKAKQDLSKALDKAQNEKDTSDLEKFFGSSGDTRRK